MQINIVQCVFSLYQSEKRHIRETQVVTVWNNLLLTSSYISKQLVLLRAFVIICNSLLNKNQTFSCSQDFYQDKFKPTRLSTSSLFLEDLNVSVQLLE